MSTIQIDLWLYGGLAQYAGENRQPGFANLKPSLPEGSTLGDLLKQFAIPGEERGITFINGDLSAMPGLQPDLQHRLCDGDRVALFHLQAMWPFQYRHGAALTTELQQALAQNETSSLHHAYTTPETKAEG